MTKIYLSTYNDLPSSSYCVDIACAPPPLVGKCGIERERVHRFALCNVSAHHCISGALSLFEKITREVGNELLQLM